MLGLSEAGIAGCAGLQTLGLSEAGIAGCAGLQTLGLSEAWAGVMPKKNYLFYNLRFFSDSRIFAETLV
jgi:hypothetical protein